MPGVALATLLALALWGCGDDGSSSEPDAGRLTVAVTDAPVDAAEAVSLSFTEVALQGVEGAEDQGPFSIPQDQQMLDLLQFQGEASAVLVTDLEIPAGVYKLRLEPDLTFTDQVQQSWIAFAADSPECAEPLPEGAVRAEAEERCRYPLEIPSGEQSGFKPKGEVTITAGGTSSVTVEFDLRKNLVDPQNPNDIAYKLKPTGLRLVDNAEVGTITGTVGSGLLDPPCSLATAAVYLYERVDEVDPFVPDDIHPQNEAYVTSVPVLAQAGGEMTYGYTIGFVPAGSYAVALTCEADLDHPEANEGLIFVAEADRVVVEAQETTVQDL
jgi:hypothetical protein